MNERHHEHAVRERWNVEAKIPLSGVADGASWHRARSVRTGEVVTLFMVGGDLALEVADAARRAYLVENPRLLPVLDVTVLGDPREGEDGEDASAADAAEGADAPGDGPLTVVEYPAPPAPPLAALFAEGPLRPETARSIIGEAATGLEAARRRGLRHQFLDSNRVFVDTEEGTVSVLGVGVEAASHKDAEHDGRLASFLDTTALVALLYRALTGSSPSSRTEPTLPLPSTLNPRPVPQELDLLCELVLTEGDEPVPETTRDLIDELEPWQSIPVTLEAYDPTAGTTRSAAAAGAGVPTSGAPTSEPSRTEPATAAGPATSEDGKADPAPDTSSTSGTQGSDTAAHRRLLSDDDAPRRDISKVHTSRTARQKAATDATPSGDSEAGSDSAGSGSAVAGAGSAAGAASAVAAAGIASKDDAGNRSGSGSQSASGAASDAEPTTGSVPESGSESASTPSSDSSSAPEPTRRWPWQRRKSADREKPTGRDDPSSTKKAAQDAPDAEEKPAARDASRGRQKPAAAQDASGDEERPAGRNASGDEETSGGTGTAAALGAAGGAAAVAGVAGASAADDSSKSSESPSGRTTSGPDDGRSRSDHETPRSSDDHAAPSPEEPEDTTGPEAAEFVRSMHLDSTRDKAAFPAHLDVQERPNPLVAAMIPPSEAGRRGTLVRGAQEDGDPSSADGVAHAPKEEGDGSPGPIIVRGRPGEIPEDDRTATGSHRGTLMRDVVGVAMSAEDSSNVYTTTAEPEYERSRQTQWILIGAVLVVIVAMVFAITSVTSGLRQSAAGPNEQTTVATQPTESATDEQVQPTEATESKTTGPPPTIGTTEVVAEGGNGNADNAKNASRMTDGSPESEWSSKTYKSAQYGGLKDAVGVKLPFEKTSTLKSVSVTTADSDGGSLELYALDDDGDRGDKLASGSFSEDGKVDLDLDEPIQSEGVELVIPELPSNTAGDGYRARIAEIKAE